MTPGLKHPTGHHDHRRAATSTGLRGLAAPTGCPVTTRLPLELWLSPEQFALVCNANPGVVLELDADGQLVTVTPTGGVTGARNSRLLMRLQLLADAPGQGMGKVFDSFGAGRPSVSSNVAAFRLSALIW